MNCIYINYIKSSALATIYSCNRIQNDKIAEFGTCVKYEIYLLDQPHKGPFCGEVRSLLHLPKSYLSLHQLLINQGEKKWKINRENFVNMSVTSCSKYIFQLKQSKNWCNELKTLHVLKVVNRTEADRMLIPQWPILSHAFNVPQF